MCLLCFDVGRWEERSKKTKQMSKVRFMIAHMQWNNSLYSNLVRRYGTRTRLSKSFPYTDAT